MTADPTYVAESRAIPMTEQPVRSVERVTVTRVVTREGLGVSDTSPVREVESFFDDDGRLIGRRDNCAR
jgi:hypothetical protein